MNFANLALSACIVLGVVGIAAGQDRMPPIPAGKMTAAQKQAAAALLAGPRTAVSGPFVPLLRSPEFMDRLQKMGAYLRFHNRLGSKLNEFVILLTARQWTQQYEWNAHYPLALKAGLPRSLLEAVREGRRPEDMSEEEAIVYDFCTELQVHRSVSDTTYARAVKKFGEPAVIDMIGTAGYYTMLSMIMNVARTPLPPGKTPALAPFPHK